MSEGPNKPPPDEVSTVVTEDVADVESDATADELEPETRALEDDGLSEESATVAIDNEATGQRVAVEAARAREFEAAAPTEYDRPGPAIEETPPELAPGTILFGEYEVGARIGAGGMGEVYRARHRRLGEDRAIKVIRPIYTADEAAKRLFDREARALLKINHPAVVRCNDMLSDETGRVYLVMEFVEGHSLAEHLLDGPLDREELEAMAGRLAAGLAAAHSEGVVHRDLSPDNVVLPGGSFESAKLIDFGIAKEVERSETTILDGFKGKVLFASPEQIGFYDGEVDHRSDYFSLGLVLATAALGRPLPMGGTLIQAVEARRQKPKLPQELSAPIRALIEPLLEVDPADRPQTLAALLPDRREQSAAVAPRAGGSPSALPIAGGLGAAVAVAAGAWFWWSQDPEPAVSTPVAGSEQAAPAPTPAAVVPTPPVPVAQEPEPPPKPAAKPVARPKGPSASDRAATLRRELRIEGLMAGAHAALAEGRLTTPPGDNAVEKLEAVLKLDPSNAEARTSLDAVGGRLLEMADVAIGRGEVDTASEYVDRAAKLAPAHPAMAETRAALAAAR